MYKNVMQVVVLRNKPIVFLTSSLPLLKFPNEMMVILPFKCIFPISLSQFEIVDRTSFSMELPQSEMCIVGNGVKL